MALDKQQTLEWLGRTLRPRSIDIGFPFMAEDLFDVGCAVGAMKDCQNPHCSSCDPKTTPKHGVTLAESRTLATARVLTDKYQRWLDEFEAAEAAKGE